MPNCDSVNARNAPTGKQRDEPVRHAAENSQQNSREGGENPNAFTEHEPAASIGKRVRQVAVRRDGAAKPREIRKGCIRRQTEHCEYGTHTDVVDRAPSRNRPDQLRQNALVTAGVRFGGTDVVRADQPGDPGQ
jgi:hypothetical protein